MKRELKEKARDTIMGAIVNEALKADEAGNTELAEAIRVEGTKLAKRLTPETSWHGLPETFR